MMSDGTAMPVLETERLHIRPFVIDDLDAIHRILNAAFGEEALERRREWLDWSIRNYTALARLYQQPYGDRAVVLTATNAVIGAVGLVPAFGPFDQLGSFRARSHNPVSNLNTPEIGLFWALDEAQRGQGYATEAAQALIGYAFAVMNLKRIVATTDYDNAASIRVMARLGMVIEHNPDPFPEWFQVVGILENLTRS
jgi:RimJ/RimL family protein N-acetyltransferase